MSIKKKSKELKLPKEKKRTPTQKKRRSRLGKHNMAPFLAPSIIGVTLFFLLPFLVVIFYSFVDNPVTKEWVWFDFSNIYFTYCTFFIIKIQGIYSDCRHKGL